MVAVGLDEGDSEMTTGAATLLLIHGFLDDATVWDGVIGSLPGDVAVRYDLPGFGRRSGAVTDACSVSLESLAVEAGEISRGSTDRSSSSARVSAPRWQNSSLHSSPTGSVGWCY